MADEIGEITVQTRVQLRDKLGRYLATLDAAAERTAKEITDKGVELARQNHAPHSRTGELSEGIIAEYHGKAGLIRSTAPHAHPIEKGAIAHMIPNAFGRDEPVLHPGNKAYPYLRQVGTQLQAFALGIAKRNYPG